MLDVVRFGSIGGWTASGSTCSTCSSRTSSCVRTPPLGPGAAQLGPAALHPRQGPAGAARAAGRVSGARRHRSGRMSVGELFTGDRAAAASCAAPRHLAFDFRLCAASQRGLASPRPLTSEKAAYGHEKWPTVVLSNHDQPRHASRLAGDPVRDLVAKAAVLLLTLRGMPFLYRRGAGHGGHSSPSPRDRRSAGPPVLATTAVENHDRSRPLPWTGDRPAGPDSTPLTSPPERVRPGLARGLWY